MRGKVGDVFQVGAGHACYLYRGADTILVEGGTYNSVDDGTINIPANPNIDSLVLRGGYEPGTDFAVHSPVLFPTFYSPANAVGDQVIVADSGVMISNIHFSFDGTADGILINADNVTLNSISVTGAQNGILATNQSGTVISDSGSSNNNRAGVDLINAAGTTTRSATSMRVAPSP